MFLQCSSCQKIWDTREDFLSDPFVKIKGYQVHFKKLTAGFFLFNHEKEDCRTTISVGVEKFYDMYQGPLFEEKQTKDIECVGNCLRPNEMNSCPNRCECVFVRAMMKTLASYSKKV